jgi:hypothetical protein
LDGALILVRVRWPLIYSGGPITSKMTPGLAWDWRSPAADLRRRPLRWREGCQQAFEQVSCGLLPCIFGLLQTDHDIDVRLGEPSLGQVQVANERVPVDALHRLCPALYAAEVVPTKSVGCEQLGQFNLGVAAEVPTSD